jgi:hypothetical protein
MPSIYFWKGWTQSYKTLWLILSALFVSTILVSWVYWFQGPSSIIRWERFQEQKIVETTVHSFRLGPFDLNVPAESYVIYEYMQGGNVEHNFVASYFFLIVIVIAAVVILSIITTLDGFWYFGGMSLFILFVVSMRLDILYLFDLKGILVPAFVIAVFIAVSYFFKSIRPQTNFVARLITFLAMAGGLAVVISYSTSIVLPFLHLAITAYTAGLVLSIIFIVMVSHEIMAGFLYVANQGGSKSLRHFLIVSVIYIANLLITALHIVGYINWDFIYVNPFLLLTISAVLGIWGFRHRENLFENIFPFAPFGGYFYIALATICFVTLAQLNGNANDAALKVVGDITIFTHTAFGIVFIMYVFSNFMAMMSEEMSVYKVLYRPNRMPYFTFRLAGIIVALAFMFVSYWRDYVAASFSGFYTYAADLYVLQGNDEFGMAFYDRGQKNAYQNHRSNYALGMMKAARFDLEEAEVRFVQASGKNPSDYSLVNRGNLYLWNQDYFGAIKTFRQVMEKKSSPALFNNLGFAYSQVHNLDSALYFFSKARGNELTKNTAEGNFFAMSAMELIPMKVDSLVRYFNSKDPGVLSNALASATLYRQDFDVEIDLFSARELNLHSATMLNNYIIKNAKSVDTTFTKRALAVANDSLNSYYSEALKSSLAYAFYHQGNVTQAYALLGEMAYISEDYKGKYNYISGLWALEQGSPESAQKYFYYSERQDYKNAKLYNAIALTESGSTPQALVAWDSLSRSDDSGQQQIANNIHKILTMTPAQAMTAPDVQKYQYARYVLKVGDTAFFSRLSNTFQNPNYKGQALLDMAKKQLRADRIIPAIRSFQRISGLELTDKKLFEDIQHFELRMLASRNEARNIAKAINKGVEFDQSRLLEKMLYTAIISETNGDTVNAEKLYAIVGKWNPYFEEGILAAAQFYKTLDPESLKAYDLLAEAIQVNATSLRLLKAYAAEALRKGFDDYAVSAGERIREIETVYR